jgi:hypothetical protein
MRHWKPNQKLTDEQIATIKHLRSIGVQLSLIADTIEQQYGVSKSTAYYHASENREAYDGTARKLREIEMHKIKARIYAMIEEGMTTQDIAQYWNMPLATVNKIYAK